MVKIELIQRSNTVISTSGSSIRTSQKLNAMSCDPRLAPTRIQLQAGVLVGTCAVLLHRPSGHGWWRSRGFYDGSLKVAGGTPRLRSGVRFGPRTRHLSQETTGNEAQTSLVLVTTNREGAPAESGAPLGGLSINTRFDPIKRRRS